MTKKLLTLLGVFTVALAFLVPLAEASVKVQGNVVGSDTLAGLQGVRVRWELNGAVSNGTEVVTNGQGFYEIPTLLPHDTAYDFIFRQQTYKIQARTILTPLFDPLNPDLIYVNDALLIKVAQ